MPNHEQTVLTDFSRNVVATAHCRGHTPCAQYAVCTNGSLGVVGQCLKCRLKLHDDPVNFLDDATILVQNFDHCVRSGVLERQRRWAVAYRTV